MESDVQFNVVSIEPRFPKSLFKMQYAYIDSEDRQSFRILERKGIRGFRVINIYDIARFKKPQPYCLIWCEVNRSEEQPFMEALQDLHRELLIMGYRDYESICGKVFETIDKAG